MPENEFDLKSFLAELPNLPGVYRHLDEEGTVLYVGRPRFEKRVSSIFRKRRPARVLHIWWRVCVVWTLPSRTEARPAACSPDQAAEAAFNILFRRQVVLSDVQQAGAALLLSWQYGRQGGFGPYPNSWAVRETIQVCSVCFGSCL